MTRCPGKGCDVELPITQFACKRHWFMLPAPLRVRITQAWTRFRAGDLKAIDDHRRATDEAKRILAA